MDRVKILVLFLALANIAAWALRHQAYPATDLEAIELQIADIEKALPAWAASAAWSKTAAEALTNPPSLSPDDLLDLLHSIAAGTGFAIGSVARHGENPWVISFEGRGTYAAVAALMAGFERSPASRIERVKLTFREEDLLAALIEGSVRSGAWCGPAIAGERPVPGPPLTPQPTIGRRALFGPRQPPGLPAAIKPAIRFLGYFTAGATPTLVLDEGGKTFLAVVGERTRTGVLIRAADHEKAVCEDERGTTWSILMEKPR